MKSFLRTPGVQVALIVAGLCAGVSAQAPSRPADPPNPFVGTWVLSVAKSRYDGAQAKQLSTRTLDLYGDRIVATHRRTSGDGGEGFSYWVGNLRGEEFPEYARQRGNAPGNMVSIRPVSPHEWNVTFRNQKGQIVLTDRWTISPDGKTLTIDRKGTRRDGQPNHSVEVYESDGYARPRSSR